MSILNLVLYALLFYMIFNVITVQKRQKKNKRLISIISIVRHTDEFFPAVDQMIADVHDAEFENKARVIKLFGLVYNKQYDGFEETLNDLYVPALMKNIKGRYDITADEDSFFYIMLSIPNMLWHDGRSDLRELIDNKLSEYSTELDGKMCKALYENFNKFYDNEDDRGLAFYERVLNGDYGEYAYGKSMIGLYKDLISCMAGQIYVDNGNEEKYEECKPIIESFKESGVGERWIRNLNLPVVLPDVEENYAPAAEEAPKEIETEEAKAELIGTVDPEPKEDESDVVDAEYTDVPVDPGEKE